MKAILWILAVPFLVLGGWGALDARSFTDQIADFGAYNPHLIHDVSTVLLTWGIALILAAHIAAWRVPVLVLVAIWNGLHSVSHIVDLGDAASRSLGIAEIVISILTAAAFAVIAARAAAK